MSKKIAVITDSNSGITQAEAKDLGIKVIPMPFMIDGVEFLEDINLTQDEFYEKLMGDCTISTSQPGPETVLEFWDEALREYDEIVHIPMSSGLSGSCQSANMIATRGGINAKIVLYKNGTYSLPITYPPIKLNT